MDLEKKVEIIKKVAAEAGFKTIPGEKKFQLYIDKDKAVAFDVTVNVATGYIQVDQGEFDEISNAVINGRVVYSLRNYSDVVHFCGIMISSAAIRARRRSKPAKA